MIIAVVIAIWTVLSVPVALLLGRMLASHPEDARRRYVHREMPPHLPISY